jgi:hypothetical protein
MNYKSQLEVDDLKNKFCTEIEDKFRSGGVIEFNNPFTIYITEENSYDDSQVKVPYLVKTLINGKYLTGVTSYGDEFDDISIYSLEDILEVAYILDTIGDKLYKILEDEQANS